MLVLLQVHFSSFPLILQVPVAFLEISFYLFSRSWFLWLIVPNTVIDTQVPLVDGEGTNEDLPWQSHIRCLTSCKGMEATVPYGELDSQCSLLPVTPSPNPFEYGQDRWLEWLAEWWFPKTHVLICECYLTQQKGLCRCDEEWGPWDGKIIPEYLGGPDLIHGSLKASLLAEVRIRASCVYRRMVREMQYCWLWRRKGAKECGQPLEAGKGKQMDSPLALPGINAALLRHPSPLFLKCSFWAYPEVTAVVIVVLCSVVCIMVPSQASPFIYFSQYCGG